MAHKDPDAYREYMRQYMMQRYNERRAEAIAILGGVCKECGGDTDLQVDHVEREKKELTFDRMVAVSHDRFLAELRKCQLLCFPCHNRKTTKELGRVPARGTHGTVSAVRYCNPRCDACRAAVREQARKRKQQER